MERYRLKNVIIVILALVNAFLLSSLLLQGAADRASHLGAAEQISALFAADGMSLAPSAIPGTTPPAARTLNRSAELEQRVASELLGAETAAADEGGGITTYTAASGSVRFRSGGAFDALLTKPRAEGVQFCTAFCRKFSYAVPQLVLDEDGSGAATAVSRHRRLDVYNASVTFTFENGALCAVSGTLVPEDDVQASAQQEPLSALSALSAFQQSRQDSGAVVSAITEIALCWELQSVSGSAQLNPAWRISTDTANFYVNCMTGAVGRG